jgi:predicted ATP-dependent endonuclease of OLD family
VKVLSNQKYASAVIYSTHSIGCLPDDLGTGVRIVKQVTTSTSALQNGFWTDGAGFSPLLASMGAAAMSFTPARRALVGEGPSDAILLPSLLRCVASSGNIGFRVAPGLSNISPSEVPELASQAGLIVFIADGDDGGRANEKKLVEGGIEPQRVILLEEGGVELETEDFVDIHILVDAINTEIQNWQVGAPVISDSDLGTSLRTKALASWCNTNGIEMPSKVAVAQRVVDRVGEVRLIEEVRSTKLEDVLSSINALLGL